MKRTRLIIALVAAILLGVLAAVILRGREPRYQGRTLTDWIKAAIAARTHHPDLDVFHRGTSDPLADPDWRAASEAVNAMAPAAIPILLKWACAKDSPIKDDAAKWVNKRLGFDGIYTDPARILNYQAQIGFGLLGGNASNAWPTLIGWTSSPDAQRRWSSFLCLAMSGPGEQILKPIVLRLEQDPDLLTSLSAKGVYVELYQRTTQTVSVNTNIPGQKASGTNAIK